MARIKHPNPRPGTFTDRLGGVVFHDGYAEVDLTHDENLADAYRMHGYLITETPAVAEFAIVELANGTILGDGQSIVTLHAYPGSNSTKAEIIAYADQHGIDLTAASNNGERLEIIRALPLPAVRSEA